MPTTASAIPDGVAAPSPTKVLKDGFDQKDPRGDTACDIQAYTSLNSTACSILLPYSEAGVVESWICGTRLS